MKLKNRLIPLLCLFALGCGNDNKSKKIPIGGEVQKSAEPQYKASDCLAGPSARQVEGTWQTVFASESFSYQMYFGFNNGNLTVTNVCTVGGISIKAQVFSQYRVLNDKIQVLSRQESSEKYDDGEVSIDCDVSVEAKEISYDLRGSCLVFVDDSGQSLYLKPAQ